MHTKCEDRKIRMAMACAFMASSCLSLIVIITLIFAVGLVDNFDFRFRFVFVYMKNKQTNAKALKKKKRLNFLFLSAV